MKTNGGGATVNTASVVAAVGIGNRAAYCASKGAVAALTRAIAVDHVGDGIRCNAIAPGTIDTPYFDDILRKSPDPGATRKALAARQLLGRLGTPRGDRGRYPVSRQRRKPLRHRHDPHVGRRHERAIARAAGLRPWSCRRDVEVACGFGFPLRCLRIDRGRRGLVEQRRAEEEWMSGSVNKVPA